MAVRGLQPVMCVQHCLNDRLGRSLCGSSPASWTWASLRLLGDLNSRPQGIAPLTGHDGKAGGPGAVQTGPAGLRRAPRAAALSWRDPWAHMHEPNWPAEAGMPAPRAACSADFRQRHTHARVDCWAVAEVSNHQGKIAQMTVPWTSARETQGQAGEVALLLSQTVRGPWLPAGHSDGNT